MEKAEKAELAEEVEDTVVHFNHNMNEVKCYVGQKRQPQQMMMLYMEIYKTSLNYALKENRNIINIGIYHSPLR